MKLSQDDISIGGFMPLYGAMNLYGREYDYYNIREDFFDGLWSWMFAHITNEQRNRKHREID